VSATGILAIAQVVLIACGAALGLWGAWMFLRQPYIVFQPSRKLRGDPASVGCRFEDVYPELPDGVRLHGWWLPHDHADKVILCFPGSKGNISDELETAAFLYRMGASVLLVDYPGFGLSGGRPSERGCYRAASAALDYAIAHKGLRPEHTILFGRSLGGTVAAWLAGRRECARLILHGAFTSVPDVAGERYPFFPVRYFCYIRFNTLKQIARCRCPIVVMHSTTDREIPPHHGERIMRAAREPKRFLPLCGGHYGDRWQTTPELRPALSRLMLDEGAWV
jgi:dipeptidyl aminopeptidase/acylaminoacyl peptidase